MTTVTLVASVLACAFSLDAQITTTLNSRSDGLTEIRIRNNSAVSLAAFAISVNYVTRDSVNNDDPLMVFVDPAIDSFPAIRGFQFPFQPRQMATGPLLPKQEFTWLPIVVVNRKTELPIFEQPIAAGIFADGTTTGDAALLTRLMDRRNNMLLAVEMSLETLLDAGNPNLPRVPRDQLIKQFRLMAESARRWYLPPEQHVGLGLYRSMIGKLMNLPKRQVGSPFPPPNFVTQETLILNRQRVKLLALLESPGEPW